MIDRRAAGALAVKTVSAPDHALLPGGLSCAPQNAAQSLARHGLPQRLSLEAKTPKSSAESEGLQHLPSERACSRHTCETYAHAFQLLLCFAATRYKTSPSSLSLEQ